MSPRPPYHRFRRRLQVGIAAGLGIALLLGAQQQGMSVAAATKPDPKIKIQKDKPLKTRAAKAEPRPPDQAQSRLLTGSPKQRWPGPGSAELTVPQPTKSLDLQALRTTASELPVWVAPSDAARQQKAKGGAISAAEVPAKVKVESLGRQGDALALKIQRTDGLAQTGRVKLGIKYQDFRDTFGGDWANRLRIVTSPVCTSAGCTSKVIPTKNNGSGELSADVPVSAQAAGLFVVAGDSSGAGDYKRSDLSGGAATWEIGGSSGNFEWSLPMDTPPGIGGPQPDLSLQYSSGGLDGLSSATNNQTSVVGQGFDLSAGGAIERRNKSCAKDKAGGNNPKDDTGDLCFAGDTVNVSMAGKSGSLVLDHRDSSGEVWRVRGDDGSLVEHKYGAVNGDDGIAASEKGEYWVMTGTDGTKFYFGLNRLPGWSSGKEETKSAWTAPIFGNQAGEQCNKPTFAASWCQQAYRWNLDYVVDRNGNTMSMFYDTEYGNYARARVATAVSPYVRAGHLKRIEYGQRDGQVFSQKAVGQVQFDTTERCTPEPCGPDKPASYPDTPWDMNCQSTTNCDNHYTPTFWTQQRLQKITTKVWRASTSSFQDVKSWTLRQEYVRGDNTSPSLWLEGITPTGYTGGQPQQLQETNFDGVPGANRVDSGSDSIPPLEWFRINAVHYGTGGDLSVTYDGIECLPSDRPAAEANDKRCRPQKWTPPGAAEREDYFHKYVVKTVSETDRTVSASDPWQAPVPVVTNVQYLDKPAWRFEEQDAGTDLKESTWSQWRGYSKVRLTKGKEGETKTVTDSLFYRGMDGDRKSASGSETKKVNLTDSTNTSVPDVNEFAGKTRERIKYDGAPTTGAIVDKTITNYWLSAPTASMTQPWGTLTARRSGDEENKQFRSTDNGNLVTGSRNVVDNATGRLTAKEEKNDVSTTADDTCRRYEYVENPAKGLLNLPTREQIVSKPCGAAWTPADVISDDRLYYDDAGSTTATPSRGQVTRVDRLTGFDTAGKEKYETEYTATFDDIGRRISVTNGLNHTTRTIVSPAYGPVTQSVDVAPNGQEMTTQFEPAFGQPVAQTKADGTTIARSLDAFGRLAKSWGPGHPKATSPADVEYEYLLRDNGASVVTTKTRLDDGAIDLKYELYDGLQRIRQTQTPASGGGWLITDHRYDSRGHVVKLNGPYYTDAIAEKELAIVNEDSLPKQEVTRYDEADRPTAQIFNSAGQEKWRINHDVTSNRQSIDPPAGETPTMRLSDSLGRLTELREYAGAHPTGTDYNKTTYSYWPSGKLKTVTDPAMNVWSYEYDPQGRKIKESDPDRGVTTYTYDRADQLASSTDANGVKLTYTYDNLGRKTSTQQVTASGSTPVSSWIYDKVVTGQLSSATQYVDGKPYTTAITGYDASTRPTGVSVTLPSSEGALAGTYTIGQTYTATGGIKTRSLPALGDLPAETLTVGYDDRSLATSLKGADSYVRDTEYTPFDEPMLMTLGTTTGKWVQQTFEHDTVTRRLSRVITDKQASPRRVSDLAYDYDPAGNITKITDTPSASSTEQTDTQCFNYDSLRRLTEAWAPKPGAGNTAGDCTAAPNSASLGGPAPYWQKWTLDKLGNRQSEQTVTPAGTTTSNYEYGSTAGSRPRQLTKVTTTAPTGSTSKTFGYDAVGGLNSTTEAGVTETMNWDAQGHLSSTSKGGKTTSSAIYDADGNRLLRRDSTGTTLTVGETELRLAPDGKTLTGTRYYSFNNSVVAVRTGGKLSWLLTDIHGTPTIAIDDTATQAVQRRRSLPYGELRGAAPAQWPGQLGYQGGTDDADTNLIHLGAREYDPSIGRFISIDPVIDPEKPQQLNGYSYANNNPVSMDDSDGRFLTLVALAVIAIQLICLVIIFYLLMKIVEAITEAVTVEVPQSFWDFFSWKTIVKFVTFLVTTYIEFRYWLKQRIEEWITVQRMEIRWEWIDKPDPKPDKGKDPEPTKPQKPDKPNKPDKPDKPDKPGKTDKQPRGKQEKEDKEKLRKLFDDGSKKTPRDLDKAGEADYAKTWDEFIKGRIDPSKTRSHAEEGLKNIKPKFDAESNDFSAIGAGSGKAGQVALWSMIATGAAVGVLKNIDKWGPLFGPFFGH
ncbi:hypothetical protein OG474_09145 [Kribbella sp. NBC_01505]|uniref:RHS repeat-associated core domain-containing protein n=1 Tax=Kribbella sp. NBC_01505 TaxID=2903580 RepID=UPI003866DCBB